ncbi:MAG: hypothetical protein J6A28_02300 [Clostridia bacterium]|nr:hypothetical protein [Clostridia bacterium]
MPEQDLFLTDYHRFVIKFDEREEENPLFQDKFWGFEMFVNIPKAFPTETLGGKQYEVRGAVKQMLTDYIIQKKDAALSAKGFLTWVNSNPGYTHFLKESGLGELKLENFSKLYYLDEKGDGFEYKTAQGNLFNKEYNVRKFKAERPIKKEGDKRVLAEDGDCNYVISIEFDDVTCKIDAPISETYVKFALQEIADLYAEKCTFKDISKTSIVNFANRHFSKALGIKIADIGSIDVQRIEMGEIMARFSHNYIKGQDIEIG